MIKEIRRESQAYIKICGAEAVPAGVSDVKRARRGPRVVCACVWQSIDVPCVCVSWLRAPLIASPDTHILKSSDRMIVIMGSQEQILRAQNLIRSETKWTTSASSDRLCHV